MIRGAIAFGLVLRMDSSLPNRQVIVTTSLTLVVLTTILFGSSMPLVTKLLKIDQANSTEPVDAEQHISKCGSFKSGRLSKLKTPEKNDSSSNVKYRGIEM